MSMMKLFFLNTPFWDEQIWSCTLNDALNQIFDFKQQQMKKLIFLYANLWFLTLKYEIFSVVSDNLNSLFEIGQELKLKLIQDPAYVNNSSLMIELSQEGIK